MAQYQPNPVMYNRKKPTVTYFTIGLMALVFVADYLSGLLLGSGGSIGLLGIFGMKINAAILEGEYWRLITPNFLHSGLQHIAANCFGLFIWGRYIEGFYGKGRYILIMLASALMCVGFSFAFNSSAALGASGIVFGLYGAMFGIWRYDKKIFNAVFGVQLLVFIGFSVVMGFMDTYTDNLGHIGGLVGGFLISRAAGLLMERNRPGYVRWIYFLLFVIVYVACLYIGIAGYFNL